MTRMKGANSRSGATAELPPIPAPLFLSDPATTPIFSRQAPVLGPKVLLANIQHPTSTPAQHRNSLNCAQHVDPHAQDW